MLNTSPAIPEVSIEQMANRAPNVMLIDVREPEEFAHEHIPGAVNIPQSDLALRLSEIPNDEPIYVTCHAGMRSIRAAQFLRQMNFDRVFSVSGGTVAWVSAQLPVCCSETATDVYTKMDASGIQTNIRRPNIAETGWSHAGGHYYEI
jgi:rhodanese-related sulfurtransferase